MIHRFICLALALSAGVACGVLAGCSSGPKAESTEAVADLNAIGMAYGQFTARHGRPPRSAEELKAELAQIDGVNPDAVLISEDDGQPYVICWNVNVNRLSAAVPPAGADEAGAAEPVIVSYVLAYEPSGAGGTRYVLFTGGEVLELTEEEFARAEFPPGHKPPAR